MNIGVFNESPLHLALKAHYSDTGSRQEVAVAGSFVADVLRPDDVIFEIQTSGFGSLRRKLGEVLAHHRVVLVHPIPYARYIVKLDQDPDRPPSRRKSPKRGAVADVLNELVSIPRLLDHPNFELEVVLTEEEELRERSDRVSWRRKGWRKVQRRLCRVLEQHRFSATDDLFRMLKAPLPEVFSTADLAVALDQPRWLAQKFAYCLREAERLEVCGKQGNAMLYRRSDPPLPGDQHSPSCTAAK